MCEPGWSALEGGSEAKPGDAGLDKTPAGQIWHSPSLTLLELLNVGDFAPVESDLHVLVHVDLLGSEVHDALGLPERCGHLIRALAESNGGRFRSRRFSSRFLLSLIGGLGLLVELGRDLLLRGRRRSAGGHGRLDGRGSG